MISRSHQAVLRDRLFRHLDGIVTAPTAYALMIKGVGDELLRKKECTLEELARRFNANAGYLNVALRICCSQGWLEQRMDMEKDEVSYAINEDTALAFRHFHLYKDVVDLLKYSGKFHRRKFELKPFLMLEKIFQSYRDDYGLVLSEDERERAIQHQILAHIEGIIVGPTIVRLGMSGMFHKYFMEASFKAEEFHEDGPSFRRLLDIFVHFGWFEKRDAIYRFTEKGVFYARRASAYGVTVSYIPTLRKVEDLLFGDPLAARRSGEGQEESHVDRAMNVWGSGGAHSRYFKVVDEIIIDIFNRPISEQPKGVLDMGCGNGAFLIHLFNVIDQLTLRGRMLDEYPLLLVGADYNETALKITKANLIQSDIWAKVVHGDIGRPDQLARTLSDSYNIDLRDLLNVRSFLDHNTIWNEPDNPGGVSGCRSTGAFSYQGKRIPNGLVERFMQEHFLGWKPYVEKWGLLLIELHTIRPELAALHPGRTASTAYDATHGYSDQYILEYDVFLSILEEAGLQADRQLSRKFPDSELATVSINLVRAGDSG